MPFSFQVPYTQGNDGEAFNQAVAQGIQNQLRQQQIQQTQIQNQYLPQMSQADIALKQAQASMLPYQAMGQYYGGMGRFNAYNPQMQLARMLQTLPPAMKAQVLAQHPEYSSILNNQFSVAGGGMGVGTQLQPQNPNLNITTTNAPITNAGNLPALPMPNAGREQQAVNQGGFNQNNLTVNPAQLASYNQAAAVDYSNAAGKGFDQMPQEQKNAAIAQLAAFKMDNTQATQYLRNGGTITQAAINAGYGSDSSKWPQPNYAPTKETITQNQGQASRSIESDYLQPLVSNWMAPYSRTFFGYSPALEYDSATGENKDAQAKALAARALAPNMADINAVLSGNPKPGSEVQERLQNAAMQTLNKLRGNTDPQTWAASQYYLQQALHGAVQRRLQMANSFGRPQPANFSSQNVGSDIQPYNWGNQPSIGTSVGNALGGGQGQGAQQPITKTLGNVTYKKVNGQWYQV
jgi:hypothetical protein